MPTYKVNLRSGAGAGDGWVNLLFDDTAAVALGDGWSANYVSGSVPDNEAGGLGGDPASGDAAWVDDENTADSGHNVADGVTAQILISGPANTNYSIDVFGYKSSGRVTEWSIDGGAGQDQDNGSKSSSPNLTGATDGSGESIISYKWGSTSTGHAYANAFQLTPVAGPSATLDDDAFEPGEAITGTYANYDSAPTVVTLTDSEDNTISSASEITDLVIDDAAKTYAFTMPDRITTGTGVTLLRGDITVELT